MKAVQASEVGDPAVLVVSRLIVAGNASNACEHRAKTNDRYHCVRIQFGRIPANRPAVDPTGP